MPLSGDKKVWWHQSDAAATTKKNRPEGVNRRWKREWMRHTENGIYMLRMVCLIL
jgi:hypothetical protein